MTGGNKLGNHDHDVDDDDDFDENLINLIVLNTSPFICKPGTRYKQ